MKIVKGTANIIGKSVKLVVAITGSTFSDIKNGFKQGYTGIPEVVEPKVVNEEQPVAKAPRQTEFVFNHID